MPGRVGDRRHAARADRPGRLVEPVPRRPRRVERSTSRRASEELGGPLWTIGMRWFAPLGGGRYAVLRSGRLAVLDEHAGTVTDVDDRPDRVERRTWRCATARWCRAAGSADRGPGRGARSTSATGTADAARRRSRPTTCRPGVPAGARGAGVHRPGRADDPGAACTRRATPSSPARTACAPPFLVHVHGGPTGKSARAQPGHRVLHQPRHRRGRGELRRLHRLRAGVPRVAQRAVGRGGRPGLRGGRGRAGRRRARRTAPGSRSAAAARAAGPRPRR